MTRKSFALVAAIAALGVATPSALASTPNGLKGYEGQPGNQGGQQNNNGTSNGLQGYEGQPGNQGG
jgi:hypothetical protein